MKKITFILAIAATIYSFNSKASVYLGYCSNSGTGVSYFFQSCVNSNNSSVGREIGGYLNYCMNIGEKVDYGFTSCVNSGFREISRVLNNKVWLQDCFSFDQNSLDYSFISCVNNNYAQVSRELNKL